MNNSKKYDKRGRPITYRSMCWEREEIPAAICIAVLMATYNLPTAFFVKAYPDEYDEVDIDIL